MKVVRKVSNNSVGPDIGEAYVELSEDGSEAYLMCISSETGLATRYCRFDASKKDAIKISMPELLEKLELVVQQISVINNAISSIEDAPSVSWIKNPNSIAVKVPVDQTLIADYMLVNTEAPTFNKTSNASGTNTDGQTSESGAKIETFETDEEREEFDTAENNQLYYVSSTETLWIYSDGDWVPLTSDVRSSDVTIEYISDETYKNLVENGQIDTNTIYVTE